MERGKIETTLRAMGIDSDSVEMHILEAVIYFNKNISDEPTLDAIYKQVRAKKIVTKNWVYKVLSELEDYGFVSSDKIRRPYLYICSEESITKGLDNLRKETLRKIDEQIKSIEKSIQTLNEIEISDLFLFLSGKQKQIVESDTFIVEGQDDVESIVTQIFFGSAKEGDVIRLLTPLSIIENGQINSGKLEREMVKALGRGLKIKSLLIPTKSDNNELSKIVKIIKDSHESIAEASERRSILSRLYPEPRATYRFFMLNEEKIALFMTNVSRPEIALIATRKGMPQLIRDGLRTWEKLWAKSIDVTTRVGAIFKNTI